MTLNIASVGMKIPGTDAKYIDFQSKSSLLDPDIIIIDPSMHSFNKYSPSNHEGRLRLYEPIPLQLKEHFEHWRKKVYEALQANKSIFMYLNKKEEIDIRSRYGKVTHTFSNYDFILSKEMTENSDGLRMVIPENNNELASYWEEVGHASEFRVLLEGANIKPTVLNKDKTKIVGARIQSKNSKGNLFLMPYIDFNNKEYEEACILGKKLIDSLCSLDEAVKSFDKLSPPPEWTSKDKYLLPKEKEIRNKLATIEDGLEELGKQKQKEEKNLASELILKRLLYETGRPLEKAVHSALKTIGFSTSRFKDSNSEFDVIFESKEGRFLGEVTGKDDNLIKFEKLRQLYTNINEDFQREDVSEQAKGALIGNAFRMKEPNEREGVFSAKCISSATQNNLALIQTDKLFEVACYLSGKPDKEFATDCRKAIFGASGEFKFPSLPNASASDELTEVDE